MYRGPLPGAGGILMSPVTCEETRTTLRAIAGGSAVPPSGAWDELLARQAVSGTLQAPKLTAVGEHVLRELETRAYRCDAWPLDRLADEETKVLGDLDSTARTAEYFLSDLGPITPAEALPYLRIVSAGLANRREAAEDLAETFRNVWGMVEVMGGDARDRLVGAELLMASGAAMSEVYAPMMTTVENLRGLGATRAVGAAAVLHLEPKDRAPTAVARWKAARAIAPTDEAAALLATVMGDPKRKELFDQFRTEFANDTGFAGRTSSAIYLASQGTPVSEAKRVRETAGLIGRDNPRPLLSAALLAAKHPLSPQELIDWVRKAGDLARRRQLASADREFEALGIALVEGLPEATFMVRSGSSSEDPLSSAATLLALHAWIYRAILDPGLEARTIGQLRPSSA